LGWPPGYRI
jgi:hypothetical protein